MGTFLGDFFRFGIWISLHTEEGLFARKWTLSVLFFNFKFFGGGNCVLFSGGGVVGWGHYVFCFPRFKILEGETVSFFCAGGGGGTMCFVFVVFRGLGVWTGKLYPFFCQGGRGEGRWGWVGELCSVFSGLSVEEKTLSLFLWGGTGGGWGGCVSCFRGLSVRFFLRGGGGGGELCECLLCRLKCLEGETVSFSSAREGGSTTSVWREKLHAFLLREWVGLCVLFSAV